MDGSWRWGRLLLWALFGALLLYVLQHSRG